MSSVVETRITRAGRTRSLSARQPDGEANVDLLLGEYRKMEPGPIEEFLFFDHPSGRTRITAAMRWKAENPETASPEEMSRPMFDSK